MKRNYALQFEDSQPWRYTLQVAHMLGPSDNVALGTSYVYDCYFLVIFDVKHLGKGSLEINQCGLFL